MHWIGYAELETCNMNLESWQNKELSELLPSILDLDWIWYSWTVLFLVNSDRCWCQ